VPRTAHRHGMATECNAGMKEPPTPPPDENATFRRLAEKLVRVPKREADQQGAAEEARRDKRPSSRNRPS
jgi:hypothetical protein